MQAPIAAARPAQYARDTGSASRLPIGWPFLQADIQPLRSAHNHYW
jgi:hypothetical protein